jgi:hypothetical protein
MFMLLLLSERRGSLWPNIGSAQAAIPDLRRKWGETLQRICRAVANDGVLLLLRQF